MSIHPSENEFLVTRPAPGRLTERHGLGGLGLETLARRFVVFNPNGSAIQAIVADGRREIGNVAAAEVVCRVVTHNPDNLWAIARRSRYDASMPVAEGFFAFLMLNQAGLDALADGSFDGANPDIAHLAAQHEKPAAIYSWAVRAPRGLAAAVPLVFEKISTPLYRDVDIFSWSTTAEGVNFVEAIGFDRGAIIGGKRIARLHWLKRSQDPEPSRPPYDSYRPGAGKKTVAIAVVRTIEDLMRVVAMRSAVYMAEQACPYEEEFDGNDFCGAHLLGYIGDEPAGCIRVRCFASFAKLERVAVRREFRSSRVAHKLIRAAIEFCRAKGYRVLYGHPRIELVRFYSRFGFRPIEGAKPFFFSGLEFLEVALLVEPHADAIAIGDDPYRVIRPEGRWHRAGILEKAHLARLTTAEKSHELSV